MSKETYIEGDYIETTGGSNLNYAKQGIENTGSSVVQNGAQNGVTYGKNQQAPKIEKIESGEAYIIVVGTQSHRSDASLTKPWNLLRDVGEGSKLMFVHQALRRMRLNKGSIKFDFLLCVRGYTEKQRSAIKSAVENLYDGKYIEVSSAQQVINYINTGDKNNNAATAKARDEKKIKQLLFYSHGVVGEISLGLAPAGIDITEYSFEESEAKKLSNQAFFSGANIYLFSCRAGIGNPDIDRSVYIDAKGSRTDPNNRYNILSSESIAQKIANAAKTTVFGYLRRTDYEKTLFTNDELCFSDYMKARQKQQNQVQNKRCSVTYLHLLDQNHELTDQEKERWREWTNIESNMTKIDGAWFDPDGARHNIEAAPSPEGVPSDMKTFIPQK
ncbi:hypothetical protein [Chryseobacterium sp.]|uniref:hypothetical protein n=1 Tax=Chryseobacterium sp. TaxID=1871047 RepID=UPI0025B991BE|nr:hypothetical protein [Chryseobacterium sp.]